MPFGVQRADALGRAIEAAVLCGAPLTAVDARSGAVPVELLLGRPPGLAVDGIGSSRAHCSSLRSVG